MSELIPNAWRLWNNLKYEGCCLSKEEACTSLARLAALLDVVDSKHRFMRRRQLQELCKDFGHPWKSDNSFLYIGIWVQPYTRWLIIWLTNVDNCRVPADLRKRMATLLWRLGERHFPYGMRTPAWGSFACYDELEVLRWWRFLPSREDQEVALYHAETELAKLPDSVVAAMGKHTAHAWISAVLLNTSPFQDKQVQTFFQRGGPRDMDQWQYSAATYRDSKPLLIEAGPGAGKTTTMAARCVFIFSESVAQSELPRMKMRVEDVVAVTFTNAAAKELRSKLDSMKVPRPSVSTMDKFCLNFISGAINRAWRSMPKAERRAVLGVKGKLLYIPLTEKRRKEMLRKAQAEEEPDDIEANKAGRSLEEVMAAAFNRADKTTADLNAGTMALLNTAQRVYREHRLLAAAKPTAAAVKDICKVILNEWQPNARDGLALAQPPVIVLKDGKIAKLDVARLTTLLADFAARLSQFGEHAPSFDFDKELLALALVHPGQPLRDAPSWVRHEGVLAAAKATAALYATKHYVIDELQDTSPAQLRLFTVLAAACPGEERGRLTMVGDCDQSIYGFRGARWANLHAEFFGADQVHRCPLQLNYRSTPAIVAACTALITPNYTDLPGQQKQLRAKRSTPAYPVRLVNCKDEDSEHAHVFAAIKAWHEAGVRSSAIAVLFRNRPGQGGMDNFVNFLKAKEWHHYVLLSDEKEESAEKRKEQNEYAFSIGTIHAAKGCEWPIVFVVGLPLATRWLEGLLSDDYPPAEMAAWAAEERRCAYVATSRAECLLHVIYSGPSCPKLYDFVGDMRSAGSAGPDIVQPVDLSQCSLAETVSNAAQPALNVTLLEPDPVRCAKLMLLAGAARPGDADMEPEDE